MNESTINNRISDIKILRNAVNFFLLFISSINVGLNQRLRMADGVINEKLLSVLSWDYREIAVIE